MATPPPQSLIDSFDFKLVGNVPRSKEPPFLGYISALDPTTAAAGVLIGGSVNTLKKVSNNVGVRPGIKRWGLADETIAGVTSSFEWYTSLGAVLPLRVTEENKLQVESMIADGVTPIWYDLMTGLDSTRFVFDTWWDDTLKKDVLLMVKFDPNIYSWQGGIAKLMSTNTSDAAGIIATMALQAPGSGYLVGDVLTVAGGTGGTLTVTSISGTGAVTGFTLTTRGTGYSNTTGAATTGGTGTGATITIVVATGEIGLDRDPNIAGYAPSGSVTINGNTYTYGSISGNSLLGVSPDPTGEANDNIVLSAVETHANSPSTTFENDFIKVIGNQLHVGSYNSRLIYISAQDDYLNYVVPIPRAPGDPDLLTLDSQARGITVQKGATDTSGNAVISGGLGDWYTVLRQNVTVGTTLTEQVTVIRSLSSDLATALAHEFIEIVGDTILFLDQNNQLREFGVVRNIVNPVYPLLSLDLFTELKGRNFTGGHMRAVSDEGDTTIYITAPVEGIDYMYQIREKIDAVGNLTAERLWQPPMVRGVSRIAVINGVTYGHSNANPCIYQLWNTNQYSDDGPSDVDGAPVQVPYASHMVLAYFSNEPRTIKMQYDKIYFEGYMTPGTILNCANNFEYQGAYNTLVTTVNNPINPGKKLAKFYSGSTDPSPAQNSIGTIPVGDGILPSNPDNPPKFRAMRRISTIESFEVALDVYSDELDCNWEIICLGTNYQHVDSQPTDIMA